MRNIYYPNFSNPSIRYIQYMIHSGTFRAADYASITSLAVNSNMISL